MIRERKELEDNLTQVIEDIQYRRKNVEEVDSFLSELGVASGFFAELAQKKELLGEIDLSLLCLVSMAVFRLTNSPQIRPDSFFTEKEIEEARRYKEDFFREINLPITLDNVIQLDYENYLTKIKIKDLAAWQNSKLILYNFETQRNPKYIKYASGVVPVPDVNLNSVKEIADHMINETYIPDTLTLNVFSEDDEPVSYDNKTKRLTINESSTISILDGFHRLQAMVRAISQNPDLTLEIGVEVKVFDTELAKKYFGQKNTINQVAKARLDELKQEKVSYVAVKQLQMNSDLKGRIAAGSKVSEIAGHYTSADILANSIEDVFEPKSMFEAREIGNYLIDFFNYLLGVFPEQFENKTIMRHHRMFAGYIVLAKVMQDNNVPLKKIRDIVPVLNITEENEELLSVVLANRGTPYNLQKKVRIYFENLDLKNIVLGEKTGV